MSCISELASHDSPTDCHLPRLLVEFDVIKITHINCDGTLNAT